MICTTNENYITMSFKPSSLEVRIYIKESYFLNVYCNIISSDSLYYCIVIVVFNIHSDQNIITAEKNKNRVIPNVTGNDKDIPVTLYNNNI